MAPPNPLPADARNCVLYGFVRRANGVAEANVSVLIGSPKANPELGYVLDTGTAVGEGILDRDIEVLTDSAGYFAAELRRGRLIRVQIVRLKLDVTAKIPDRNNQDIAFWAYPPSINDSRQFVADPVNAPAVVDTSVIVKLDQTYLPNILDLYDQMKLYRASTKNGAYVEVTAAATRPELVPGTIFYEFTNTATAAGLWYRAALYNSVTLTEGPMSLPYKATAPDYANILTVDELKEHYLFGVRQNDDFGRPYPRSMYEGYIREAIGWLERSLVVSLKPTARTERQDYYCRDFSEYGHLQLDFVPVLAVDTVQYMLGDSVLFTAPSTWLQTDTENGTLHVVPQQGALANALLSQAGIYVGPGIIWYNRQFPGFFRVTYRHGFGLNQIPPEIKHLIAMQAAISVLNIAGDLLVGAGIANLSVSTGGTSQSVGTTSSATNAGYGARIIEYKKEIKEKLPGLIRHWRGVRGMVA